MLAVPFGGFLNTAPHPLLPITTCIQLTLDSKGDQLGRSIGHNEGTPNHTDSENRPAHAATWAVSPLALGRLLLSQGCPLPWAVLSV